MAPQGTFDSAWRDFWLSQQRVVMGGEKRVYCIGWGEARMLVNTTQDCLHNKEVSCPVVNSAVLGCYSFRVDLR